MQHYCNDISSTKRYRESFNIILKKYNLLENPDASLHFLKKAELLCQNSLTFRVLTYNNFALYYRRYFNVKKS